MAHDPSSGIQVDLLPHLHLISAAKYPMMPRVEVHDVTKMLLDAPRIAKTQSPFFWTYLDRPADGTLLLAWQPTARVGPQFATDGLIWGPPENYFKQDVGNGLTLEIYFYKSGCVPGEQVTLHSRKRFRLVPTPGAAPSNGPQPDPNLFLVHYGPAEPADRLPAATIPFDERVQSLMNNRQYMLRLGPIPRKDFMLADRNNWPQIHLPRDGRPVFISGPPQRGVPQQMAYPAHPPAAAPPTKRARHSAAAAATTTAAPAPAAAAPLMPPAVIQPPAPPPEVILAEEEDNFRGDMFDQVTPREIAMIRYQQNHEWMEQIIASPYPLSCIIAPELGFGKKGPLASLTDGIFTAQGIDALEGDPENPYTKPLDPKQADEFRKRIADHIAASQAEMAKMTEDHTRSLAKSAASRELIRLEKDLRPAVFADGPDSWSVNGGIEGDDDDSDNGAADAQVPCRSVDDVLAAVAKKVPAPPVAVPKVYRIQDGGYVPPPERQPTPELALAKAATTGIADVDVEMGGNNGIEASASGTAGAELKTGGDWVMVPKHSTPHQPGSMPISVPVGGAGIVPSGAPPGAIRPPQPAEMLPAGSGFESGEFTTMVDDMDTAGEALSSYENMEMEDSAFGDAFHAVDADASQS
ncbi:hypothetical protein CFIMG_004616RA [Ceratocystis fimbriata CBS 114723]|uniref:SWI/SNF and RSC complexes subunit ssr4 n=1 Tax=Ceratocystis fimbriata CBS 114723 TaxID=1035309 RepID=A0A2C5WXK4_9PEZI|nr:hypothetical protein CFIMG_004616RA [Ceratocystis fimbriata CBS 114723]